MGNIPVYPAGGQVAIAGANPAVIGSAKRPDLEALAGVGDAVTSFGSKLAYAEKKKNEELEQRKKELERKRKHAEAAEHYHTATMAVIDWETASLTALGKDALGLTKRAQTFLQQTYEDIDSKISDPDVKQAFKENYLSIIQRTTHNASIVEAKQARLYGADMFDANKKAMLQTVLNQPLDDAVADNALQTLEKMAYNTLDISEPAIRELVDQAKLEAKLARITGLMVTDPVSSSKLLERWKGEIGDNYVKLKERIDAKASDAKVAGAWERAIGAGSFNGALGVIEKAGLTAEEKEKAIRSAATFFDLRQRISDKAQHDADSAGALKLENMLADPNLNPAEFIKTVNTMAATGKISQGLAVSYVARGGRATAEPNHELYHGIRSKIDDMLEGKGVVKVEDIVKERDRLGPQLTEMLRDRLDQVRAKVYSVAAGEADDAQKRITAEDAHWASRGEALIKALATEEKKGLNKENVGQALASWDVSIRKGGLKGKAIFDEAVRLTNEQITIKRPWFDKKVPAWQRYGGVGITEVPKEQRAALESIARHYGIDPEQMPDDAWVEQYASMSDEEIAQEMQFARWYSERAKKTGLNPNPDFPGHKYDYRAAWKAGVEPVENAKDGWHWDSRFKAPDHPNRFVDGVDTITGKAVQK